MLMRNDPFNTLFIHSYDLHFITKSIRDSSKPKLALVNPISTTEDKAKLITENKCIP